MPAGLQVRAGKLFTPFGRENTYRFGLSFSQSLFTGGLFSFQPEIKSGTGDANTRYSNTLANIAISAVTP